MSYEADVMSGLRIAIRDEMPALKYEIRNMNKRNETLIEALNESVKEQKVANLLRLCEISMQRPELNLLSSSETVEILKTVKESIAPKEQVKEEPKRRGFFK